MKISLLVTAFNSTSQLAYTYLKDRKISVDVVFFIDEMQITKEIEAFAPNAIICPYLKKFVPQALYEKYTTFILHPGVQGDRGAYSLDNALREERREWGLVYLKADDEFDSGAIYAQEFFQMRNTYKSSLYRNELNRASLKAIETLLKNIQNSNFTPLAQLSKPMHLQLNQKDRQIDWQRETTQDILKKIHMSDSHPGVLDEILGVRCYLYGAWREEKLRGKPKEILAKRDGAICIGTIMVRYG